MSSDTRFMRLVGPLGAVLVVTALMWEAPASHAQGQPEVWQFVTFRFQPGRGVEATEIFSQLLVPIYRDNPFLLSFRGYREAESPVPLDLIVVSRYGGMGGMDESNRWHQQNGAATGRGVGPLYRRLSDLSVSHDDQFIEILPQLTLTPKEPARLQVFEWVRLAAGGRTRYPRVLEASVVPWERTQSIIKGSRTGHVLVGDGWDYCRLVGFDSLGDFQVAAGRARGQAFTAELDALVASRRTIVVREATELAIR